MAASVCSTSSRSTVTTCSSVAGLITSYVAVMSYIRSKLRTRSQSVTAASNAASSTRAAFV